MKSLRDIIDNLHCIEVINFTKDIEVEGLYLDTRDIKPQTKDAYACFAAIKGNDTDGHLFIDKAIENGAKIILLQEKEYINYDSDIIYILVKDTSEAIALMAKNYYDSPSDHIVLVGITGTNGKTTTVTLLYELFTSLGHKCGKISTISNIIAGKEIPTDRTTPQVIVLNKLIRQMVDQGCKYCFMEVSSHSIVQKRILGLNFRLAMFSNITLDHLDYHKTFANYIKAKKMFFDSLSKTSIALTNKDDRNGMVMLQNTLAHKFTYSLESVDSDFFARILESDFSSMQISINNRPIEVNNLSISGNRDLSFYSLLVGKFNAYNILCVFSAALLLGKDAHLVAQKFSTLLPAKGRFETYKLKNHSFAVIDYAHTPDALKNVLLTIKGSINSKQNKIITLVGCGGDRDKSKRPIMAQIGLQNSNTLILTSDNPRTEDPKAILSDMQEGIKDSLEDKSKEVFVIEDRAQAIKVAVSLANKGDIILIAGKGHETYQEIMGVKHHFDDKEQVAKYM